MAQKVSGAQVPNVTGVGGKLDFVGPAERGKGFRKEESGTPSRTIAREGLLRGYECGGCHLCRQT